jgi:hypothetical protein
MPPAAVYADDHLATRRQSNAIRMIEAMTGDVQVAAVAIGFEAFEAEQTVLGAGNQLRDLGRSHFDLTAMGGEDGDRRLGAVDLDDAEISVLRFVPLKFRE